MRLSPFGQQPPALFNARCERYERSADSFDCVPERYKRNADLFNHSPGPYRRTAGPIAAALDPYEHLAGRLDASPGRLNRHTSIDRDIQTCRFRPGPYVDRPTHALPPMPAFSRLPVPELLAAATRLYTGLRDNAEIAADLAPFGYDTDDATDGLALVDEVREAMKTQTDEETQKISASKASTEATAAARAAFVVHRKRARRAHPAGSAGYSALDLSGSVSDGEIPMLAEARRFYQALGSSPDLAGAVRNLPPQAITDALGLVTAAETAEDTQTKETGESERASALAAPLVARLRAEAAQLAEDAKDALSGKPQLREVIGLMERGS